jgi:hypothetical protein
MSSEKQRMVMASLSNLAKFLNIYQGWKQTIQNSGLKWSKNDSFKSFIRIFNNNHSELKDWYAKATSVLRDNERMFLRFLLLTGIRKNEAIESFNLIIDSYKQNKLNEYYNEELSILEHYRYRQFLRPTKNCYISIVPKDLIYKIANSSKVSYNAIRKRLFSNNLSVRIKELRSYWASYMVKNRILISEEADICQGRIPRSVFARHYLKENIGELSNRILVALAELEKTIN